MIKKHNEKNINIETIEAANINFIFFAIVKKIVKKNVQALSSKIIFTIHLSIRYKWIVFKLRIIVTGLIDSCNNEINVIMSSFVEKHV